MLELGIRLILSLSVVLGLLLLLARFGGRRFRGNRDAMVQVLHRQHLTRGSAISVVSVGSRVLVLGTTEQQVRVLAELDPDEIVVPALEPDLAEEEQPKAAISAVPSSGNTPLAGSILSADTWRQALAAATRRAS